MDQATGAGWTCTSLSSKTNGDSIHPDQHCLAFDPQNGEVVYGDCDGGRGARSGEVTAKASCRRPPMS